MSTPMSDDETRQALRMAGMSKCGRPVNSRMFSGLFCELDAGHPGECRVLSLPRYAAVKPEWAGSSTRQGRLDELDTIFDALHAGAEINFEWIEKRRRYLCALAKPLAREGK